MIRFSSVAVPFASATIPLTTGAVLSPVQLAELVAVNALPEAVAVVCADRPTLLTATKAFGQALRAAPKVAPVAPVAVAEAARFGKAVLAPVAETSASLAARWGAVVDGQANTIVALQAEVAALKQQLAEATSAPVAPATPKRTRKAKAAPKAAPVEAASVDAEFAGFLPVEDEFSEEVY
jgi:hypothetical protein